MHARRGRWCVIVGAVGRFAAVVMLVSQLRY